MGRLGRTVRGALPGRRRAVKRAVPGTCCTTASSERAHRLPSLCCSSPTHRPGGTPSAGPRRVQRPPCSLHRPVPHPSQKPCAPSEAMEKSSPISAGTGTCSACTSLPRSRTRYRPRAPTNHSTPSGAGASVLPGRTVWFTTAWTLATPRRASSSEPWVPTQIRPAVSRASAVICACGPPGRGCSATVTWSPSCRCKPFSVPTHSRCASSCTSAVTARLVSPLARTSLRSAGVSAAAGDASSSPKHRLQRREIQRWTGEIRAVTGTSARRRLSAGLVGISALALAC